MDTYLAPNWERSALVLIDVQNDFVYGPAAVAGTEDLLPAMAAVAATFRDNDRPILHVIRAYEPGDSDVDLVRRASIEAGQHLVAPSTAGADIVSELVPAQTALNWDELLGTGIQQVNPREFILLKRRWSAFYRTDADALLRDLGVDTVVVAGCNLPNCPRATLFDASERDYRTVLVSDATSQSTNDRLADLGLIGVQVMTSDRLFVQ